MRDLALTFSPNGEKVNWWICAAEQWGVFFQSLEPGVCLLPEDEFDYSNSKCFPGDIVTFVP